MSSTIQNEPKDARILMNQSLLKQNFQSFSNTMSPNKGFPAVIDPRTTASQTKLLSTITKPKEFEVVDRIYKNEMEDIEKRLKEESPQKLKKLNLNSTLNLKTQEHKKSL